ncbi:unnamed protein product [Macrosiphum euphorbiae]|uniref:Tudor-knot domain-containing protein n=1 Tax=Macrosiphum euphorbiae TaxID=13131 RepID=A0AAV0X4B3_9HEMI|nr:unnamed protein product [Macrosiphum euphorbiae]
MPPRSRKKASKPAQPAKPTKKPKLGSETMELICAMIGVTEPEKPPQVRGRFKPGEKVYCEWDGIYYRGNILKRLTGKNYYSIHYWKFTKRWDMPVNQKALLRFDTRDNDKYVKKYNAFSRKVKKEKKKIIDKIMSNVEKGIPIIPIDILPFDPKKCKVMVREDGTIYNLPRDSITTILPEIEVESPPVNNESSEQEENVQPSISSAVSGNDLNPESSSLSPILEEVQESKTDSTQNYDTYSTKEKVAIDFLAKNMTKNKYQNNFIQNYEDFTSNYKSNLNPLETAGSSEITTTAYNKRKTNDFDADSFDVYGSIKKIKSLKKKSSTDDLEQDIIDSHLDLASDNSSFGSEKLDQTEPNNSSIQTTILINHLENKNINALVWHPLKYNTTKDY